MLPTDERQIDEYFCKLYFFEIIHQAHKRAS